MTTAEAGPFDAFTVQGALQRELDFHLLVQQVGPIGDLYRRATQAEYDRRTLAARVRELEAHTCDTCDNQQVDEGDPKSPWCRFLTTLARGKYPIYCYDVDQGCNAWKDRKSVV